jgi:DNA polymerase-3 subunit beta
MKLVFSKTDLLGAVQIVARATAVRSAIQALAGILIKAEGNRIELAATDTEIALRSEVPGEIETPGSVLLPGRLLADILRALGSDSVSLEHQPEKGQVQVTSGQTRFALKALLADDFPRLPEAPGSESMRVPAKVFAKTIEQVARAASRDDTRPVLTGILVSVSGEELQMVATDSYRLSVKETRLESAVTGDFEANVPARALQELSRISAEADVEEVSAAIQDSQIVFGVGRAILSSRTIEGQFPNYQQLLPETYEHEVRVAKPELVGAVRRISLMAQRNAPLRLKFESGSVSISAQTPDVGEASEDLPVNYGGETLEIGFNPQFLQDGLEGVEGDELVLKLISPLRPGLIEAADSDGDGVKGRFLYLIMPVRLNV